VVRRENRLIYCHIRLTVFGFACGHAVEGSTLDSAERDFVAFLGISDRLLCRVSVLASEEAGTAEGPEDVAAHPRQELYHA
jgi:hypothetical protein